MIVEDVEYSLMDEFGNDVCTGVMIPTQPGAIVHNKPLGPGFGKFQVTAVVNDGYDSDITEDAFVVWELCKTKAPGSFTEIRRLRNHVPRKYCESDSSDGENTKKMNEGKKVVKKRRNEKDQKEEKGVEKTVAKNNHWNM